MTPRAGIGFDSHRLEAGRRLVLGGVEIEGAPAGLAGHSDADVLTHAVIDALLGAAGLGDIGQHFPDTDERWRDADSLELLRAVRDKLERRRLQPANIDATLACEEPKLAPSVTTCARAWPRRRARSERGERQVHDRRADGLRGPRRGDRGAGDRDGRRGVGNHRIQESLGPLDVGTCPVSSITRSGQSSRALAPSARLRGTKRSWLPQIRVVGTSMRRSSASGICFVQRLDQPPHRALHVRHRRPLARVDAPRLEPIRVASLRRVEVEEREAVEPLGVLLGRAEVEPGRQDHQPERNPVGPDPRSPRRSRALGASRRAYRVAGRQGAEQGVRDQLGPVLAGGIEQSAEPVRERRRSSGRPRAPTRQGRARRGRRRGGSRRAARSPGPSTPRRTRCRHGAGRAEAHHRPPGRRSSRRPAGSGVR